MSRFRMFLVTALVVVIVGGHLFDAWKQKDHWPFAAYPMFARVNRPEPFTSEELWGVTPDGREVPITSRMTGIMGTNRIRPSLFKLYLTGQRAKDPTIPQDALRELLKDYEQRRQRKQHDGPQLSGMRFYQLKWDFDWWAKNRDAPQRTVLFEVHS